MPPKKQRQAPLPKGAHAQGSYRAVYIRSTDPAEGPVLRWVEKRTHAIHELVRGEKVVRQPMTKRMRFRFAKGSVNQAEWKKYFHYFSRMPTELKDCIARPLGIATHEKEDVLYMELICDKDGTPSKSLGEQGPVANVHFWKTFDALMQWMKRSRVAHFDLNQFNVLVKKQSPTKWIPVLVDLKSVNAKRFILQPWNFIPRVAHAKMMRRYEKMREEYARS